MDVTSGVAKDPFLALMIYMNVLEREDEISSLTNVTKIVWKAYCNAHIGTLQWDIDGVGK